MPDHVVGDDGRLRQVLLNLLSNAIKFTERGQVVLEIEKEWEHGGQVALHGVVRDTGIGIPPERREAIFEPFTQADGSTTRQFGGTGLGLTISAQLVALMGGAIWVESEVGRGSALPFPRAAWPRPRPPARPRPGATHDLAGLAHPGRRRRRDQPPDPGGDAPGVGLRAHAGRKRRGGPRRARGGAGRRRALPARASRRAACRGWTASRWRRDPSATPAGAAAILMMLSSSSHAAEAARCRELGDLPYVVKPVDPSHLLDPSWPR